MSNHGVDFLFEIRYPEKTDTAYSYIEKLLQTMSDRIEIYEQAFRQIEIDNKRAVYFNEIATMQTIKVARRKLNET